MGKKINCLSCLSLIEDTDTICPICGKNVLGSVINERVLPPGIILNGRYLIGKVIGEGGFGITYLGLDMNLQIKVAIKEYFPISFAARNMNLNQGNSVHVIGGQTEQFYKKGLNDYANEANRLSKFSQLPGIVSVMNFFYENNTAYIVMEYINGITLKEHLKNQNGKIHWKKAVDMMRLVVSSLKEVHKAGIIHRDISPDNIMITEQGQMVLIDFGSARTMEKDHAHTVILKKAYAPLEQYQTNGDQGTWSDVYSLCATLYKMICGENVPDAMAVAAGQARILPLKAFDSSVSKELDSTIQKGLLTDIGNRIRTMEELEACLYEGKKVKKSKKIDIQRNGKWFAVAVIVLCIAGCLLLSGKMKTEDTDEIEGSSEVTAMDMTDKENSTETESMEEVNAVEETDEIAALTDTASYLLEYKDEGDGITITSVDYMQTAVVIPGEIEGKQVKKIAGVSPNAVSVIMKEGVETIGYNAFANCVYLETVYIPSTVTSIEAEAFKNCEMLTEVIVSENNPSFYSENGNLYTKDGELIHGKK